MFHHNAENLESTGEPPTQPPDNANDVADAMSSQRQPNADRGSSRSQTAQEPDSGYEASPSSIADNVSCNLHFFGDRSGATPSTSADSLSPGHQSGSVEDESEYQDCPSITLFVDCESDADYSDVDVNEWNVCSDCNSAFCSGCYRTDSSTTNATTSGATAIVGDYFINCDNSSSSNYSDLSSSNRPSSLPIQIPVVHTQRQHLPWTNYNSSPVVDLRLQPCRSHPVDIRSSSPGLRTISLIAQSHPMSWPSTFAPYRDRGDASTVLPIMMDNLRSNILDSLNRSRRHNREHQRSRRRLIDSDASSSLTSSDEDGPEDVFNMAVDESSQSFELCECPMVTEGRSLPDVVPHSPAAVGRYRSVSVNLPPEPNPELIQSIGSSLRRLSEQFERRRELLANGRLSQRRQTVGEIVNQFSRSS